MGWNDSVAPAAIEENADDKKKSFENLALRDNAPPMVLSNVKEEIEKITKNIETLRF